MQIRALPPDVKPAPVLVRAGAGFISADREIQVLPVPVGLIRFDAWPADFFRQQSGNRQRVIAHQFGVQTPAALGCQFAIERIALLNFFRENRGLLVGVAVGDQADHMFHVPAVVHEFAGQPVQQRLVEGHFALRAKIVHDA